jgi:hypothetical protein
LANCRPASPTHPFRTSGGNRRRDPSLFALSEDDVGPPILDARSCAPTRVEKGLGIECAGLLRFQGEIPWRPRCFGAVAERRAYAATFLRFAKRALWQANAGWDERFGVLSLFDVELPALTWASKANPKLCNHRASQGVTSRPCHPSSLGPCPFQPPCCGRRRTAAASFATGTHGARGSR